jgi:hypothetical protein
MNTTTTTDTAEARAALQSAIDCLSLNGTILREGGNLLDAEKNFAQARRVQPVLDAVRRGDMAKARTLAERLPGKLIGLVLSDHNREAVARALGLPTDAT